jgi:hypothetical protein
MTLDLTDEEAAALLSLLNRTIADDRYPLSPRIGMLRCIQAKLGKCANYAKRVGIIDPARRSRWSARLSKRAARCNISFRAPAN